MERVYSIDQIKTDDINQLTIMLNEMQEVSHIKIFKDSITFNCARPDNVQTVLKESDLDYTLKEIINENKREYEASSTKIEQFFMFENLEKEEEAQEIREVLSKYSAYENINLDFQNKVLSLTSSHRNVLTRLRRITANINKDIKVEQWKKPFKSQDIFNEKYIQKYIRAAIFLVGIAIALVTRKDTTFLTYIGWLLVLLVCSEEIWKSALKDLKLKQWTSEHIIIFIAALAGWAYQAFLEAIIVVILYQLGQLMISILSHQTMDKIGKLVTNEYHGRCLKDGEEVMIPVTDFDIGDTMIVKEGETVLLGGQIIEGDAKLDVYAIDGSDLLVDASEGLEVYSGTVVSAGEIKMEVTGIYEDSVMNTVINIAMKAPVNKSKSEFIIDKIATGYSLLLVVIGILCIALTPVLYPGEDIHTYYAGIIMLTIAGGSIYKQGASYSLIAGVAKALTERIVIKENSGLDDLSSCATVIYDRFDGIETTDEELDLFEKLNHIHKTFIIFNDGPTDMENDQYKIHNNLSVEEKLEIMDKAMIAGPVAYIGDCDKDIALLQKASIGISRGGVHNSKVIKNSDIMLTDSNFDTIIDLFDITRKQKAVNIQNTVMGLILSLVVVVLAVIDFMYWPIAMIIYFVAYTFVLLNTQRITNM